MADQKRDDGGRFGSGGGYEKGTTHGNGASVPNFFSPREQRERKAAINELKKPAKDEASDPGTMQGEAGRLARQQARDCNTGRYRQ